MPTYCIYNEKEKRNKDQMDKFFSYDTIIQHYLFPVMRCTHLGFNKKQNPTVRSPSANHKFDLLGVSCRRYIHVIEDVGRNIRVNY